MCLGHTVVSSGPRLEETGVQGSHGIAAAAGFVANLHLRRFVLWSLPVTYGA
jgi:hypothetical protein